MLQQFSFYLRQRGLAVETRGAHVNRAKIILGISTSWRYDEAQKWLIERADARNYTASTMNKWIQTFNALDRCFDWKWEKYLKHLKEDNRTPYLLSMSETLEFYKLDTTPKWNLIIRLLISTGARPSEILSLRRGEVDVGAGEIYLHHTKTKKNRVLIIPDFLVGDIKQWIQDNQIKPAELMFFYRDRQKRLSERSLINEYNRRLKILGIDKAITPYSARHGYISRMVATVNAGILAEMVGHVNIQTTQNYIHNNAYIIRDASEKDILFDSFRGVEKQVQKLTSDISKLCANPRFNAVKLAEAIACLQAATINP